MLTLRKRGRVYHVRGSIRVGSETRIVKEHSTGCDRRDEAETYRARLESDIRKELLHGAGGQARRFTVADAGLRWIGRPGGVASYDQWRLSQINDLIGDYTIANAQKGWAAFKQQRCAGLKPSTVERFRGVLQSALNYIAREEQFDAPKIRRTEQIKPKAIRYLTKSQADRLIASYVVHLRPLALTLCYQGIRIGEALRVDWTHLDFRAGTIFIPESKTGVQRTVTIHSRVRKALRLVWAKQKFPKEGRVFLNRLGKPFADPREYELPGGSPIRKAHQTACKRAQIDNFTVHDWRHHWACQCVMAGIDLESIRLEGGWKDFRMVRRYASSITA